MNTPAIYVMLLYSIICQHIKQTNVSPDPRPTRAAADGPGGWKAGSGVSGGMIMCFVCIYVHILYAYKSKTPNTRQQNQLTHHSLATITIIEKSPQ